MNGQNSPEQGVASRDPHRPMADVPPRGSIDTALRSAMTQQTQLSTMADAKANLMITVSSIVLSVAFTQVEDETLRWPLLVLGVFSTSSLVLAVLAVLPAWAKRNEPGALRRPVNPFFFGSFAHLDIDEYLDALARTLRDDASLYETIGRDLHGQGVVLARHKYRYLRYSYLLFLTGMVATAVVTFVALLL